MEYPKAPRRKVKEYIVKLNTECIYHNIFAGIEALNEQQVCVRREVLR